MVMAVLLVIDECHWWGECPDWTCNGA